MPWSKKYWNSAVALMAAILLGWFIVHLVQGSPSNWKPWEAPDLREEPVYWAKLQLGRLRHDPALCRKVLRESGLKFTPIADEPSPIGCGLTGVVLTSRAEFPIPEISLRPAR